MMDWLKTIYEATGAPAHFWISSLVVVIVGGSLGLLALKLIDFQYRKDQAREILQEQQAANIADIKNLLVKLAEAGPYGMAAAAQEALTDLKEGDTSAAESVLDSYASRKALEVGQAAREEAANVYRRLGFLAATSNQKRASVYFKKAADLTVDIEAIRRGISRGQAQIAAEQETRGDLVDMIRPHVIELHDQLSSGLNEVWRRLSTEDVAFALSPRRPDLESLFNSVRAGTRYVETLMEAYLGTDNPNTTAGPFFSFRVNLVLPHGQLEGEMPKDCLPFVFYIQRWKNDMAPGRTFPATTHLLTKDPDGRLRLWEEHFRNPRETKLEAVIDFILTLIQDEAAWQAAQHYR